MVDVVVFIVCLFVCLFVCLLFLVFFAFLGQHGRTRAAFNIRILLLGHFVQGSLTRQRVLMAGVALTVDG